MMKALIHKWRLSHAFMASGMAVYLGVMASLMACGEESTSRFSRHRAFLRFSPVAAAPVLSAAVHGVGEWCAITYDASLHLHQCCPAYEPIPTYGTRCLWSSCFDSWFCGGHSSLARPERTAVGRGFRSCLPVLLSRSLCGTPTFVGIFCTWCAHLWPLSAALRPQQWRRSECDQGRWPTQCVALPLFRCLLDPIRCFCRTKLAKTFGHFS